MKRGTSFESQAARCSGDKHDLRARSLAYIRQRRENGATADEVCAALGMGHNSIAPRLTELRAQGLITDLFERTGKRIRRKTRQGCAASVVVAMEFAEQSPQVNRSLFGDRPPESRYPD
jgi:DNA-binding transcriptional ArsR family regulator